MAESVRTTLSLLEFRTIVPLIEEVSRSLVAEGKDDSGFSRVRVVDPIVYSTESREGAVIIPDIYYVQAENGLGREYIQAVHEAATLYESSTQQSLNESSPYISEDQAENEAKAYAVRLTYEFIGRRIAGQG